MNGKRYANYIPCAGSWYCYCSLFLRELVRLPFLERFLHCSPGLQVAILAHR